jgi:hypothetical protein
MLASMSVVRRGAVLPLIISVVCGALLARMAFRDGRVLLPMAVVMAAAVVPMLLARRRMRLMFLSGDVNRVLGAWRRSIEQVVYPETMAPLMVATAYASYGWTEAARTALGRAKKGAAWDAAIEQRLFVEALLDTFEGDAGAALAKTEVLTALPMPRAGFFARRRVSKVRTGLAAMVRAFQHIARKGDLAALREAADVSPLVHWPMTYAAAIIAVDEGRARDAEDLVDAAPEWPNESVFRSFDGELRARLPAS